MYCTIEDLGKVLSQETLKRLTDENAAQIKEDRLERAVDYAQTMIDAHLAGSYDLPVEANALLNDIAVNMAVYRLYLNCCGDETPDYVQEAYVNGIELLKKLQNGELNLQGRRQSETLCTKTPHDRLFPHKLLKGL